MIKIKLTSNSPTWPLIKQTPNSSGIWNDYQFFVNDELKECDWWIIYDNLIKDEEVVCPKKNTILFTAEPPAIKKYNKKFLRQFGFIVSCHPNIKGKNVIHTQTSLPWYIGWNVKDNLLNIYNKNYDELKNSEYNKKTKLLSIISSSKNRTEGHKKRLNFVYKLKEHFGDKIDIFGAQINKVPDKWDAIAPYKYHISIENSLCQNYWTEKLTDVYLSDSYPIYSGCPNITDYFPADSLTIIDINKPQEAIKIIEKTINSKAFENSIDSRKKSKKLILNQYQIFPSIVNFIKNNENDFEKTKIKIYPESYFKNTLLTKLIIKLRTIISIGAKNPEKILLLSLDRIKRILISSFKDLLGTRSFALYNIDLKLKKYLLPMKNGVFIEAGANDGVKQSNTFLFEKKYKWTGLLIEGIPSLYEKCKVNRSKSIVEKYVLGSRDGEIVKMKHINLMSFVEGSFKTIEEEKSHLDFGIKYNIPYFEIEAKTIRLSTLIDKHNIKHIDFFSLDVEGYELEVLKGIDFTRHRPTYILVEARYEEEINKFMKKVGYQTIEKMSFHDILYKDSNE